MDQKEIYETLKAYLQITFEVPEENVSPDARLLEDLDLDSIDAVDLMVKLEKISGRKIQPSEFKEIKTLNDIVEKVFKILDD
jgi:acyl carrier protein